MVWLCCILGLANIFIYEIIRIQEAFKDNVGGGRALIDSLIQNFKQNPFATILNLGNTMGDILFKPLFFVGLYFVITLLSKSLIFGFSEFCRVINYYSQPIQIRKLLIFGIVTILVLGLITYGIRGHRGLERASLYGDTYKYVSNQLKPGEKIGYVLSNRSYLLYGEKLDKQVVYLGSKSNDLSCYLDNLHKAHISFIALGPFGGLSSTKKADCIVKNSNLFTPLFYLDPNVSQALYTISVDP